MRSFGCPALALVWLLFCACRDAEPAKAPASAGRPPPAARAAFVQLGDRPSQAEPAPARLGAPGSAARAPHAGHAPASATLPDARLAERFNGARSLSTLSGSASYYADHFAGRSTASGAPYEPRAFTAAHRALPFGTVLRVTRVDGGQVVYVRVTDRGPFGQRARILDLSRAAAEVLGMLRAGVVKVRAEVVEYGPRRSKQQRRRRR